MEQLEIMFEDLRNTGDDHWSACSGVAPALTSLSCGNSQVNDEDEADNDSEPEQRNTYQ